MRKSVTLQADALRRRAGLSMDDLARAMGKKRASSVQRYLSDSLYKKPWLPLDIVRDMAKAVVGMGSPPITEWEVFALAGPGVGASVDRKVPVISMVQAGNWAEATDPYPAGQGYETIYADRPVSSRAFALDIVGPSMLQRFNEGDRIIIDPDIEPIPGDFVVAKLQNENEATFKQYRPRGFDSKKRPVIELRPLNEDWPPIPMDANNPGKIVGTMVEHHGYRRKGGR